jgi:hypothetical protein
MSKSRLLRLAFWSSVMLAMLFQVVFLLELHTPLPSDLALLSLGILSVSCLALALLARWTLAADAKIRYSPEEVYTERHFDAGLQYRVPGTYCVILSRQPPMHYPRTRYFYLNEPSADRALTIASVENPQWRAIVVEPSNLSVPMMPQGDHSRSTSDTWHVA